MDDVVTSLVLVPADLTNTVCKVDDIIHYIFHYKFISCCVHAASGDVIVSKKEAY